MSAICDGVGFLMPVPVHVPYLLVPFRIRSISRNGWQMASDIIIVARNSPDVHFCIKFTVHYTSFIALLTELSRTIDCACVIVAGSYVKISALVD